MTAHRLTSLLLTLALVLSACGGSDGGADVFAFEDIAIGSAVMTPALSGTTATLTVETNIDAVCAVAFGETEDLGGLATDQDMGGAGHSDHEAVLTGLSPDTEYFYRLQGVAADGRLFQSELMTFRTPAADESAADGNVAVGAAIVDFSSEFSASFAASLAVDGDPNTEWSSRGDGDDAYVTIDLGRPVAITAVGFETRSMSDGTATTETFTVTIDGVAFGPFPVGVAAVQASGQVVRFDVATSTGGNTGASELQVFTAP